MATFGRVVARTAQAVADLSGAQYHLLRHTAEGQVAVASDAGAGVDELVGILQNKPTSGNAATVGYQGQSKITVGGSVTVHTLLTTNGAGRATAATSGNWTFGQALEAASANGEVIRCLLRLPAVQLPTSVNP